MITLAKYPLTAPTPKLVQWIAANIDPADTAPWYTRSWPGFGNVGLTYPTGYRIPRKVRVGRFVWPLGASSWAYAHYLAQATYADQIRDVAYTSSGNQNTPIDLVLTSDPVGGQNPPQTEKIDTQMYLLSIIPLTQFGSPPIPNTDNLYLLTLVDQRYYWWNISNPVFNITFSSRSATFNTLFTAIQTALAPLSVTINLPTTINAAYLNASMAFNLDYEAMPPVLDALAYNIGCRVVRKFDGSVYIQQFSDGLTAAQNDFSTTKYPNRALRAGGDQFASNL